MKTPRRKARALHITNPYMRGRDVKRAQKLLAQHGFHPGATDGEYGPATAEATRRAKYALGYPFGNVDGVFGERLLAFLAGKKKVPPAWAKTAKARASELGRHTNLRTALVAEAQWMISHEPQIHYRQSRPIDGLKTRRKLPLYTDCSGSITDLYKWVGGPDPNGNHFNGSGYTGTMLTHGRPIARSQAKPGDLVVFGAFPGHHVCMVMLAGDDPLLFSHGQERGPFAIRYSQEARFQSGAVTWLSVLPS